MKKSNVEEMNLQMFGWDDVLAEPGHGGNKTDFTKLENGITELRFLDAEPFSRWAHWLQNAKRNISCIGAECPVCEAIKNAKANGTKTNLSSNRKFAMHVYNITTGRMEILEQGKTFFVQLHALHEEMGDIRGYNIKVKTQGAGTKEVMFTLLPCAPSELSDEITSKINELKPFEEVFKKPTREQIIQLMNGVSPEEVFGNANKSSDEDENVGC